MPRAPGAAPEMPEIPEDAELPRHDVIYFDYNGVLNTERDVEAGMCAFFVALDQLRNARPMQFRLLSFAPSDYRQKETLRQLDEARVLDFFDRIVFTKKRTRYQQRGRLWSQQFLYHPTQDPQMRQTPVKWEIYAGGKDQYIASHSGNEAEDRVFFIDDKWETLDCVKEVTPLVTVIQMQRSMYANEFHVAHDLHELYHVICRFQCPVDKPCTHQEPCVLWRHLNPWWYRHHRRAGH